MKISGGGDDDGLSWGGWCFSVACFFLVGDDGVPGYPIKKGGEVMVVDFSEMRIFGVIWRYQKFSQPR